MRELPSLVKGAGLRTLSFRSSWVQIALPAFNVSHKVAFLCGLYNESCKNLWNIHNNASLQVLNILYKFLLDYCDRKFFLYCDSYLNFLIYPLFFLNFA